MEYGHWVEEQRKKSCELRTALQGQVGDVELLFLVESGLKHYYDLFRMKAEAAKADIFFLMSGAWRTSAERFFLWIGGFRPSELLNVRISFPLAFPFDASFTRTKCLPIQRIFCLCNKESLPKPQFRSVDYSTGSTAAYRSFDRTTDAASVQPPTFVPASRRGSI